MDIENFKTYSSHGSGEFLPEQFMALGENIIFEKGVLVFHPENVILGNNLYIGHRSILKGYYKNQMVIGEHTWIGQDCFLQSAGGLKVGRCVGIGPKVAILTSSHSDPGVGFPIMKGTLDFAPVEIGDGSDIGVSAVILPGVKIGQGVVIGAGAVVTHDIPDYAVAVGVPARVVKIRK